MHHQKPDTRINEKHPRTQGEHFSDENSKHPEIHRIAHIPIQAGYLDLSLLQKQEVAQAA